MAITGKLAWGLEKLEMADLGKIATATWKQIGNVLEGSISLNFDSPTANEVRVEEKGTAVLIKYEEGSKNIELDIPNIDSDMLEKLTGATTTNGITAIPDTTQVLRKMLKFTFKEGGALYLTNASIVTNPAGGITKTGTDVFQIHVMIGVNAGLGGASYETEGIMIGTATPTT